MFLLLFSCSTGKKESKADLDSEEPKRVPEKLSAVFSQDDVVDSYAFDLNDDGKMDSIFLLEPTVGDPGLFQEILFANNEQVISLDGLNAYDTLSWQPTSNLANSNKIYIAESDKSKYLFLSGTSYSCCPVNTTIFKFTSGLPELIYSKEYQIEHVKDLDGDGILELIGKASLDEVLQNLDSIDGYVASYSPYSVYELKNGKVWMSYEKSKKYNEMNYVFAGYEYSEDVQVVIYREDKQPKLLDSLDKYECNIDYVSKISRELDDPDEKTILEFLLTFDERCQDNVEFSEFSAEVLIDLLTNYPGRLIKVWESNMEVLAHDQLIAEIRSPLIEPNYPFLESKLEEVPPSDLKSEIVMMVDEAQHRAE
jgi:hypothetical protein